LPWPRTSAEQDPPCRQEELGHRDVGWAIGIIEQEMKGGAAMVETLKNLQFDIETSNEIRYKEQASCTAERAIGIIEQEMTWFSSSRLALLRRFAP